MDLLSRKQLRQSVTEGNAASLMQAFGVDFIPAFALKSGAGVAQIGILASLPHLLYLVAQIATWKITQITNSRLGPLTIGTAVQAAVWFGFAVLALFPEPSFWVILTGFMLIHGLSAMINPFWTSWISDWLPKGKGAFLGFRNKMNGAVLIFGTLTAGALLGTFESANRILLGFAAAFLIAGIARGVCAYLFSRSKERKSVAVQPISLSQIQKIHQKKNGFWTFTKHSAFLSFAVSLAAPFFVVYYLEDLSVSLPIFAAIMAGMSFALFFTMPYWGRFADRYGNRTLAMYAWGMIPLIPLGYLVTRQLWFLLLVEFFSGLAWAAQRISSFNLLLEHSPKKNRAAYVGYFNAFNGLGNFAGALLGGFLAAYFKTSGMNLFGLQGLVLLFALSGILRSLAVILYVPHLRTEMSRTHESAHVYFKAVTIAPLKSSFAVLVHDVEETLETTGKALRKIEKREDKWVGKMGGKERDSVRRWFDPINHYASRLDGESEKPDRSDHK